MEEHILIKLKPLLILVYIGACAAYPSGPPVSTCEGMSPLHFGSDRRPLPAQPGNTNPYRITVSNSSYSPGDTLTVTISSQTADQFKGFILQARGAGSNSPVGVFTGSLASHTQFIWCSGGEPQNTVGHKHGQTRISWSSLAFKWRAPAQSAGNVTFRATVVKSFSEFWLGISSNLVSGPPAANITAPTLGPSFQITKVGCGQAKGCLSVPEDCTNSEDCDFFVTYRASGENVTFEMSGKHKYISLGFNEKTEMNNTDVIACATLPNSLVEVRHFYNDYHSPLRGPLTGYIFPEATVSENGITKCRLTRKIAAPGPRMRDLTKKLHFIFARGVTGGEGSIQYHWTNRSWSASPIDVTVPVIISRKTVLPTDKPIVGNEVSTSGCGSTKGCFSVPSGCTTSDNCDYLLTYRATQTGEIVFELSGKSSWVSVGFNDKPEMDKGDMLVCAAAGGQVAVDHYYAANGRAPPTKTDPRPNPIELEAGGNSGGVITCRFKRELNPQVANMRDLNQTWYLLYARGPMSGNTIGRHTYRGFSSQRVNVNVASVIQAGEKPVLIKLHGILMILSWMGCATIAIFMARYMRPAWPQRKLFNKNLWFVFHRSLMATCLVLTSIGFILIFVHVRDWSQGEASKHAIIGVIVTVLTFVQPIMAFFRPHPGEPKRPIFNYAHRSVGLSAWILSVVNMFLGLLLPHLDLKNIGLYIMIVFCVCVGVVLILELYICCATDEESGGYNMGDPSKIGGMKMEDPDEKKNSAAPSQQDLVIRQMFLGFLILAVTALIITSLVFIREA